MKFTLSATEVVRSGHLRLVSVSDDALAWPEAQIDEGTEPQRVVELRKMTSDHIARYRERYAYSELPIRPDGVPVQYEVRPLSREETDWIEMRAAADAAAASSKPAVRAYMTGELIALAAYDAALVAIHDAPLSDGSRAIIPATDSRRLDVPRQIRAEIGSYIWRASTEVVPDFC